MGKRSTTSVAAITATLILCALPGCTYRSTLDSKFYTARESSTPSDQKIPLAVALVQNDELENLELAESGGGHGVRIKLGDAVLSSLKTEMESLFKSVTVVRTPGTDPAVDAYAFAKLDWRRVSGDAESGNYSYRVLLEVLLKDRELKYVIGRYRSIKPAYYSPSAAAQAAAVVTGASLFLLAPITVPLATEAVGSRAEDVARKAITSVVRAVGDDMAADGRLRDYKEVAGVQPDMRTTIKNEGGSTYATPSSPYDRLLDGVVVITTPGAIGSGFFVSSDGYIVTNRHVVGSRGLVSVKVRSGLTLTGTVVAESQEKDLALLKVSGEGHRWLELSTGADAGVGREVLAIGTPQGLSWSVSKGIVSALRDLRGLRLIQTDAAINAGNSGGPLIELVSNKVIGVNTLTFRKDLAEGLNFAVSAEDVRMVFGSYLQHAKHS